MSKLPAVRQQRYQQLRDVGASPELASRGRGWSNARFAKEIKRLQNNRRRRETRSALRRVGLTPAQADSLKGASQDTIQRLISERTRRGDFVPPTLPKDVLWSEWSKNEFPDNIEELAKDINERAGFDPNDSYGYRYLNHLLVEREIDIEDLDLDDIDFDDAANFDSEYWQKFAAV